MVKYSKKPVLTRELATVIAKKREGRTRVRVAGNASRPLTASSTLGDDVVEQTKANERVNKSLFAGAFELAAAERDATERMQAAAAVTPVVDEGELLVHIDGVVPLIARERVVAALMSTLAIDDNDDDDDDGEQGAVGSARDEAVSVEWPFASDMYLATYYAPLFWNAAHYAGGAEAVRAADCSVVRAAITALAPNEDACQRLLARFSS